MTTPQRRWPAADQRWELFGEVALTGLLVTVAALPVVTAVPALAAGCAHLRAHLRAERATMGGFARLVRAALPGSWRVTAPLVALALLLAVDLRIAGAGLPGAGMVRAVGAVLPLPALVVIARLAAAWRPGDGWGAPWARAARAATADLRGSVLVAGAWVLVAVLTWQLPPLLVPAVGCLVLAAVTIDAAAHLRAG